MSDKPGVNAVLLQNAVLCADCEVISDSPHDACRVCGSRSLFSLSHVLGGPLPAQRIRLVETTTQNMGVAAPAFALTCLPRRKRPRRRMPSREWLRNR